jgi:hypothetical protein
MVDSLPDGRQHGSNSRRKCPKLARSGNFLFRCEQQGLLSGADLELLVRIKLEGSRSEPGQTSLVYSNALRQKIKRLLRKLRDAARLPSTAVQQRAPLEPT